MSPNPAIDDVSSEYIGEELELFQHAVNWKHYLAAQVKPFASGDVLEVGAGLGVNVNYFHRDDLTRWLSIEPDVRLCDGYRKRQTEGGIPARCELKQQTLENIPPDVSFDSILYIDVLEHIEDDRAEFQRAFQRLRDGGHLIILCPAYNHLFSPFDKAIGHFRRYNKSMYRALSQQQPVKLQYLDSIGLLASLANKMLLKQSYPTASQIKVWDRVFVRCSKLCDPLFFHLFGKSLLGIWRKDPTAKP